MILLAALLLAGSTIDEAEHALAAGRTEQASQMVRQMIESGLVSDRIDRLRASIAAANGQDQQALSLFSGLARKYANDAALAEGAARAAFRLGRLEDASQWAALATARPNAGWRAWNLCGVIADQRQDFSRADECYSRALSLGPNRPEIFNNQGWSLLLRGQWTDAAKQLQMALAADPANRIARANLELAEAALTQDLPAKRENETLDAYAARLNDIGVIAEAAGDRKRAVAAFSQSVSIHPRWSEKAASNLARAEQR
ncbi:tetratricopeptide repeat protein [Sphingomonas sp. HDW15A]|uniref:tetratricopeptide repeat protein n=1 Tax=Sphingomonas sp. HDW15A TaxID=2714942 RepID=UPI00140E6C55|nr:tetratricopeptide repeat protein [Sphingomonas sp. HDW15A]QIK95681.1 tetratricopeptide repeat protein [Sphingomonas sp. HDW15A]